METSFSQLSLTPRVFTKSFIQEFPNVFSKQNPSDLGITSVIRLFWKRKNETLRLAIDKSYYQNTSIYADAISCANFVMEKLCASLANIVEKGDCQILLTKKPLKLSNVNVQFDRQGNEREGFLLLFTVFGDEIIGQENEIPNEKSFIEVYPESKSYFLPHCYVEEKETLELKLFLEMENGSFVPFETDIVNGFHNIQFERFSPVSQVLSQIISNVKTKLEGNVFFYAESEDTFYVEECTPKNRGKKYGKVTFKNPQVYLPETEANNKKLCLHFKATVTPFKEASILPFEIPNYPNLDQPFKTLFESFLFDFTGKYATPRAQLWHEDQSILTKLDLQHSTGQNTVCLYKVDTSKPANEIISGLVKRIHQDILDGQFVRDNDTVLAELKNPKLSLDFCFDTKTFIFIASTPSYKFHTKTTRDRPSKKQATTTMTFEEVEKIAYGHFD